MLKWQCHEVFWNILFHESNPSGPYCIINRLKCFLLKIRFRGDIQILSDFVQANTARSQTLHRQHCAELNSTQSNTAPSQKNKFSQIQNWLTLRRVRLRAVLACAETNNIFWFSKISISREFRIQLFNFF